MLDFDGTLAPFTPIRDEAAFYPGVAKVIEDIMNIENTRVVIVSGRKIADIIPLLDLKSLPEIWGSHGWERRLPDGSYYIWPLDKKHQEGLQKIRAAIAGNMLNEYCEEKPRSMALHWRGAGDDEISRLRRFVDDSMRPLCGRYGHDLREFDGGVEARAPGKNKGDVVRTIMSESPDNCLFVYLGDDQTDEDAFKIIERDGIGILAGESKRNSMARFYLKPPEELLDLLQNWRDALQGGSPSAD